MITPQLSYEEEEYGQVHLCSNIMVAVTAGMTIESKTYRFSCYEFLDIVQSDATK